MSIRKRFWITAEERRSATVEDRKPRKEVAWIVDYSAYDHKSGEWKRRHKTFRTKGDAEKWWRDNARDVQSRSHVPASTSPTIAAAVETWIEAVRHGRDGRGPAASSTLRNYRYIADNFIVPKLGRTKLCDLTTAQVEDWKNDVLKSGRLARSMVRFALACMKGVIAVAIHRGDVAFNVASRIHVGRSREEKQPVAIPERAEVQAILAAMDRLAVPGRQGRLWRRYRLIIALGIHTGMRIGELRGLYWSCVDLQNAKLHVRRIVDESNKVKPVTKTDAGYRTVDIPADAVRMLREWKLEAGPYELVFPTREGKPEWHSNIYRRGWFPAQIEAGVFDQITDASGKTIQEPRYNFHALRHFHASAMIEHGASPLEVAAKLGHADVVEVLRTYAHLFRDADSERKRAEKAEQVARWIKSGS